MTRPRAAVDSGTNSTRLLVVDAQGNEIVRRSTVTRLGQGVDATGRLAPEALQRTLDVIAEYRDAWVAAGVEPPDVRIAATSAVRDAANRDAYVDRVLELTGVTPEVVPGEDEARLSYLGATSQLDVAPPTLVCDVGGGSTELVVGDATGVVAAHSMQVGSVRVTERCLHDDPPTASQVDDARAMVDRALGTAVEALGQAGARLSSVRTVVAVAGTATTLAALHAGGGTTGDDPAVHGHEVPADELSAWAERLLAMPVAERAALPAVVSGREDVVAAGVLVLDQVVARAEARSVVVSTADNLDGLVLELA